MSEAPDLKVVPIRDGRPLINDIPNRLRHLADLIESGKEKADYVLVIADGDRAIPTMYGYGDALDTREILGLLSLASDWFVRQVVAADAEHGEDS